ncbi:MAG: hypothetical protein AAF399_24595 [Bacteroidota bacterium]
MTGTYLFGDFGNGNIWSLSLQDAPTPLHLTTWAETDPQQKKGISSFAFSSEGDVYVLVLCGTNQQGGQIQRMQRSIRPSA